MDIFLLIVLYTFHVSILYTEQAFRFSPKESNGTVGFGQAKGIPWNYVQVQSWSYHALRAFCLAFLIEGQPNSLTSPASQGRKLNLLGLVSSWLVVVYQTEPYNLEAHSQDKNM